MNELNTMALNIGKQISAVFRAPAPRRADPHRKARTQAKALAEEHGIEIERLRDGGFNVWPPKTFSGVDPHDGDHFANDWDQVLQMVLAYAPEAPHSHVNVPPQHTAAAS